MIPERSVIEQAYAFFHQKLKVYEHSPSEKEMDHIEDVIASYVDGMSPSLYEALAEGKASFLHEHGCFREELSEAVRKMESWLEQDDENPDKDNRNDFIDHLLNIRNDSLKRIEIRIVPESITTSNWNE